MLIKANSTKKWKVAFLSPDATDKEIKEFVKFLQANDGGNTEAKDPDKTKTSRECQKKSKEMKKAAEGKPSR